MNEMREWYMPPTEAVDKGFMDGIFGDTWFPNAGRNQTTLTGSL